MKTTTITSLFFATLIVPFAATSARAAETATDKADKAAVKADKAADASAQAAVEKKDQVADQAAADKSGGGPVVNGESLTATTDRAAPAARFGRKGQIAISSDAALTISSSSTSGRSGSTTNIQLEPAIDYFLINNLSLGGFLEFAYTSTGSSHGTTFGIGPRVGYNFPLSDLISVWAKVGLSFASTSLTTDVSPTVAGVPVPGPTTSSTVSSSGVALNLFVPVMFHPAPHFFAGFGPFLDTDLSGDSKTTTWGGKLTLGGWVL